MCEFQLSEDAKVEKHATEDKWLLCMEQYLKTPMQNNNGTPEISFPRASPVLDLSRSPEVRPGRFRPRPGKAAHSLPWASGDASQTLLQGFWAALLPCPSKGPAVNQRRALRAPSLAHFLVLARMMQQADVTEGCYDVRRLRAGRMTSPPRNSCGALWFPGGRHSRTDQ